MMPDPSTPLISLLDPFGSDSDGHLVNDAWNEALRELTPTRPSRTLTEWRSEHGGSAFSVTIFGAGIGHRRAAGLAMCGTFVDGSNPSLAVVQIAVKPRHRRVGIGAQLLRRSVEFAIESGRSSILGDTHDTVPAGAKFAGRFGGRSGLASQAVELDIGLLDDALIDRWIGDGPARADGYMVVIAHGAFPEGYVEDLANVIWSIAGDIPTEDLEFEPLAASSARIKVDRERALDTFDFLMAIAIEQASGRPVGISEVVRSRTSPQVLQTTLTGVVSEHRGHALGKWMKASLYRSVLERWPEARFINTENAGSNEAMRRINDELGFALVHTETAFQADVATITAELDAYERDEA